MCFGLCGWDLVYIRCIFFYLRKSLKLDQNHKCLFNMFKILLKIRIKKKQEEIREWFGKCKWQHQQVQFRLVNIHKFIQMRLFSFYIKYPTPSSICSGSRLSLYPLLVSKVRGRRVLFFSPHSEPTIHPTPRMWLGVSYFPANEIVMLYIQTEIWHVSPKLDVAKFEMYNTDYFARLPREIIWMFLSFQPLPFLFVLYLFLLFIFCRFFLLLLVHLCKNHFDEHMTLICHLWRILRELLPFLFTVDCCWKIWIICRALRNRISCWLEEIIEIFSAEKLWPKYCYSIFWMNERYYFKSKIVIHIGCSYNIWILHKQKFSFSHWAWPCQSELRY